MILLSFSSKYKLTVKFSHHKFQNPKIPFCIYFDRLYNYQCYLLQFIYWTEMLFEVCQKLISPQAVLQDLEKCELSIFNKSNLKLWTKLSLVCENTWATNSLNIINLSLLRCYLCNMPWYILRTYAASSNH